jgi:hypothetical protein
MNADWEYGESVYETNLIPFIYLFLWWAEWGKRENGEVGSPEDCAGS